MVAHQRHTDDLDLYLYDRNIEKVKSFRYLGLELNSAGSFKLGIKKASQLSSQGICKPKTAI